MQPIARTAVLALPFLTACSSGGSGGPLPEEIALATNPLSSTAVQVDWTDGSGTTVDTYEVFANGASVGAVPGTEAMIVVADLTPDESHCFEVLARGANGSAMHTSNEDCAQTLPDAIPGSPPLVTADAVSPARIDLSWSSVIDDFGPVTYWVLRDGAFLGFSTSTTYQDVGLTPLTTYSYQILAEDSLGQLSPPTAPVSATTLPDLFPPTVSTGLTARLEELGNGLRGVLLEWDPSVDDGFVVGYRVFRDGTQLEQVVGTSYVDTTFFDDVQHCYQVFPVDTAGNVPPASAEACLQTGWELDTVAQSGDLGRSAALVALDSERILVVHGDGASLGAGSGLILQSTWNGTSWTTDYIDLGVLVESSFDLERGPAGVPHLAALRRGPQLGLVHAEFETDVWEATVVDTTPFVGIHPSLEIASDGRPVVAYLSGTANVHFADEAGGTWPSLALSGPDVTVVQPSLTVEPNGTLHLVVAAVSPTAVVHARIQGFSVGFEVFAPTVDPFVAPQAALAANGDLHLVYRNQIGRIQHGVWNGSGWALESVSSASVNATLPHLVIGGDGTLHVAYFDVGHTALVHARRVGGQWVRAIVDDEVSVTDRVRIDVGADGSLAMAYRGGTDLKVARRAGP